jgi:hypothetical protein
MIKPVERQPERVAGGSSELEKRDFTILRLDHRLTEVIQNWVVSGLPTTPPELWSGRAPAAYKPSTLNF